MSVPQHWASAASWQRPPSLPSQRSPASPGPAGGEERPESWAQELETRERLWSALFESPGEWLDFRALKASGRVSAQHADFARPNTPEAVWVDSFFLPPWVLEKLQAADAGEAAWRLASYGDVQEERWRPLFDAPDEWLDRRAMKEAGEGARSHCDFEHQTTGEQLRIDDADVPAWVLAELATVEASGEPRWRVAGDALAQTWQELFQEPSKWLDLRPLKAAGGAVAAQPDFLHQWSGRPVWMEMMPNWVAEKVRLADQGAAPLWPTSRSGAV